MLSSKNNCGLIWLLLLTDSFKSQFDGHWDNETTVLKVSQSIIIKTPLPLTYWRQFLSILVFSAKLCLPISTPMNYKIVDYFGISISINLVLACLVPWASEWLQVCKVRDNQILIFNQELHGTCISHGTCAPANAWHFILIKNLAAEFNFTNQAGSRTKTSHIKAFRQKAVI